MKTSGFKVFAAFICFLLMNESKAQWLVGGNLKVYDPQGSFNKNIHSVPAGISLVGHRKGKGRWSIGGEIGVAMYSNDQYQYDLTEEGFPGQSLTVDEEDCFWTIHAAARYETFSTPSVRQYLELRVGGTTFFSTITALEEHNTVFEDKFDFHDTAFNTGIGTGISINPKGVLSGGERTGQLWIDLGLNVHGGSRATYRNFKGVEGERLKLREGNFNSLTSYIDYRLGVLFEL